MHHILRLATALTVSLLSLTVQADIQQKLDSLEPGTTFRLPAEAVSPLVIKVPGVTVACSPETLIDGGGEGNAVEIRAEDVTLRGCRIRNWGTDLNKMNAGIFTSREARGATIEENDLQGSAFGIWLDATPDITVRNNTVR